MKIAPTSNIAIKGVHCPNGVPVDTDDVTALILVAQGLAVRVRDVPAAPVVETAEAPRATETAAVKRARK